MLELKFDKATYYDERSERFLNVEPTVVELEHSLFSVSKWESKWETPFISDEPKTTEQTVDYIRQMLVSGELPEPLDQVLLSEHISQVSNYINSKQTATWFNERKATNAREIVTSEIIYYWMVTLNIPFECDRWHFNKLMTLIQVCNDKNNPKKMSRSDAARRQRELNEARRKKFGTSG